jgi:hypothetical protein
MSWTSLSQELHRLSSGRCVEYEIGLLTHKPLEQMKDFVAYVDRVIHTVHDGSSQNVNCNVTPKPL